MTRPRKKSEDYVYFVPTGFRDGKALVLKFFVTPDDRLRHCVTYTVTSKGECDCKGGTYRNRCKHVDLTIDDCPGDVVSLKEARLEISRLTKWLHTYFIFVDLPSVGLYNIQDGKIVEASLRATGADKRIECPFPKDGSWRVYMPGTNFKITVCVSELKGFRDAAPPPYYPSIPRRVAR